MFTEVLPPTLCELRDETEFRPADRVFAIGDAFFRNLLLVEFAFDVGVRFMAVDFLLTAPLSCLFMSPPSPATLQSDITHCTQFLY